MRWFPILLMLFVFSPVIVASISASNTEDFRINIDPDAVRYDARNGTYLSYWLNSSVTELPVAGYVWSLILPLWIYLGWWIFPILFFVFMMGIYLRTQDVGLPLVAGAVASTVMGVFFPWEAKIIAGMVLALCLGGLLVHAFYGQYN